MSRSPAISTLLILTLCIVGEVLSAPSEEMIREGSGQEKFLKSREADVSERVPGTSRYENIGESREDEMRPKRTTLVEGLESVKTEDRTAATKEQIADKPKDNSTSNADSPEAKDMRQSHVAPKDYDDSTDAETPLSGVSEVTANSSSVDPSTHKLSTDISHVASSGGRVNTPKAVGDKVRNEPENNKRIEAGPNVAANSTTMAPADVAEISKNTSPTSSTILPTTTVVTSEPSVTSPTTSEETAIATTAATTNATAAATTNASTTAATHTSTTTIASTVTGTVMTTASSTESEVVTGNSMTFASTEMYSEAEAALHAKKPTSMPAGIVALIIAIAFACVSVMAYIGLVVWRRYLEWRYGNRELLVNEFDANDISNFEL